MKWFDFQVVDVEALFLAQHAGQRVARAQVQMERHVAQRTVEVDDGGLTAGPLETGRELARHHRRSDATLGTHHRQGLRALAKLALALGAEGIDPEQAGKRHS